MLTPWNKNYDQPRQHIKKQGHYFANKSPSNEGYGFSSSHIWTESWIIKKAEHWRIDAFELWFWRRLLRVPWTARRSNQSIIKEISPEYSLEGLMLKLKFQSFNHLMQRTDSFEKTLMLGKIEGSKRRGQQRTRRLDVITDSMEMSMSKLQELVMDWHSAVHEVAKSWTWLSNWTHLNYPVWDFPCGSAVKNTPAVQMWIRSLVGEDPWRRKWQLSPYSCLENPKDRGAWQITVHGVARVEQDLTTKPLPPPIILFIEFLHFFFL